MEYSKAMIMPCKEKDVQGRSYRCYFDLALMVIGGKWKLVIIHKLALGQVLRFGDLARLAEGITERMLARQLKELEKDGIVERTVHAGVPVRVEYRLTALGHTLLPILEDLRQWGVLFEREHYAVSFAPTEGYENSEDSILCCTPPADAHKP